MLLGLCFIAGFLGRPWLEFSFRPGSTAAQFPPPENLNTISRTLFAEAATNDGAFAVATGPIDQEVEGFYTLDYLTGELQCSVLSYRTGKFLGLFRANVVNDLGVGQNPKYLMVTGRISLPRGAAPARLAESVVYVLDSNSGNFVAYTLPWRRELASVGSPQSGRLVVLDVGRARETPIRE